MKTVGGQSITIHGSNFGPVDRDSVSGTLFNGETHLEIDASICAIEVEHTQIRRTAKPLGSIGLVGSAMSSRNKKYADLHD